MEDLDVGVYDVLSCKGLRQLHSNLESGEYECVIIMTMFFVLYFFYFTILSG